MLLEVGMTLLVGFRIASQLWHNPQNVQITNNVSYANQHGIVVGADRKHGHIVKNVTVSNNIFANNEQYGMRDMGNQGSGITYTNNVVYGNKRNLGLSMKNKQSGMVNTNPGFVNPAAGNFSLHSSSAAAQMGAGLKPMGRCP